MPTEDGRKPMSVARLIMLALAAASPTAPLRAEPNPWYAGTSATVSHDSNIFRRDEDAAGDTVTSLGVQAGLDQRISRQRVYADAQIAANRYERFRALDSTSYSLSSGVDWATLEHLSGQLRYAASSGLADYSLADAPETTEKNVLSTRQAQATVRYDLHSALSLNGSFDHRSVDYSAEVYKPFASEQNVLGGGLRYRVGPRLAVGVGWRHTRGRTPDYQAAPGVFELDRLRRDDLDLTMTWATERTALTARLSRSHEWHSQESAPGFSGLTGAIDLDYQVLAKLRLSASASRDTGSATTFFRFGNGGFDVDNRQVTTRIRASLAYAPSAKLSATLLGSYERGRVSSLFGSSHDHIASWGLQGSWEPRGWLRLSCSGQRETRDSTLDGRDSKATVASCSAGVTIR